MDQVARRVGDRDLGFQCDVRQIFAHCLSVEERRNKHEAGFRPVRRILFLLYWRPPSRGRETLQRSLGDSLGVVLYELLTGRMPYDISRLTLQSAARIICEQEAGRPSELDRRLRGDLETILLKALQKDRAKRYASAEALAEDLRRHQRGESISARPPTRWMRISRWARMHPIASVTLVSLLIAGVIVGGTGASIVYLRSRPDAVVLYRGAVRVLNSDVELFDEARLIAVSGDVLQRWGGAEDSIAGAYLIDRSASLGGGRLAVIGYTSRETGGLSGKLCAYDVASATNAPIWVRDVQTPELLPELRNVRHREGEYYFARSVLAADVFGDPEHPGTEIVCVFVQTYSQRLIRIYDVAGKLLYQNWHEGASDYPYFMRSAGLLIFRGDDAYYNWDRSGRPVLDVPNPTVIFALRPTANDINTHGYLQAADAGPFAPIWTRCLYQGATPVDPAALKYFRLLAPEDQRDPGRFVGVSFGITADKLMTLILDEFGNEVPVARIVGDAYRIALNSGEDVADPNSFHLGPIPDWARDAEQSRP